MDYFAYKNKKLYCEDVNLQEIVEECGTPTYVYSKKTLERHVDVYKNAFKSHKNLICFSVKSHRPLHHQKLKSNFISAEVLGNVISKNFN